MSGDQQSGPALSPEAIAQATVLALREPFDELRGRLAALEAVAVGKRIKAEPDPLREVWSAAPLVSRVNFVRGLLPASHPARTALGELLALLELLASPGEIEAWSIRYPSLFADAAARMVLPLPATEADGPEALLAAELLQEAWTQCGPVVADLGVSWVIPARGSAPGSDCEVVGEEPVSGLQAGVVQRVRRPGFRRAGRLELPAQVVVAGASTGASIPTSQPSRADVPVQPLKPETSTLEPLREGPEWLQAVQHVARGDAEPQGLQWLAALRRVALAGRAASDADVAAALGPLLSWLGTGWGGASIIPARWLEALAPYRDTLGGWLSSELKGELVNAAERDAFDPALMEAIGERRTAHPHERGTVARQQAPGLRREGRVLLRARVIRYETGGSA